jgi:hypothetical protein
MGECDRHEPRVPYRVAVPLPGAAYTVGQLVVASQGM